MGGTGFMHSSYPPSLLNPYANKNENILHNWEDHLHWAKGLWEAAFPGAGAQLGQFKFVPNYSLRMGLIVHGGTCFSQLTVKGV